jgi:hypothetical protein
LFDLPQPEQVDVVIAKYASKRTQPATSDGVVQYLYLQHEQLEFWIAPVQVCKTLLRTVGMVHYYQTTCTATKVHSLDSATDTLYNLLA